MRVRPVFLIVLLLSCVSVLIFAATYHLDAPAILQVHLERPQPSSHEITNVIVHLTDPEGVPIEQAHILSQATMTNMKMSDIKSAASESGHGDYVAQFHLSMAGPWAIIFSVHAEGFSAARQVVMLNVV